MSAATPNGNGRGEVARSLGALASNAASALIAAAIMGLFWMWYTQGQLDTRVKEEEAKSTSQAATVEAVRTQMSDIKAGVARIEGALGIRATSPPVGER